MDKSRTTKYKWFFPDLFYLSIWAQLVAGVFSLGQSWRVTVRHLLETGMADDEILRAEMVSQLCMNDRTHSSLLDLISFTAPTRCLGGRDTHDVTMC